jgi:hypothetical protein
VGTVIIRLEVEGKGNVTGDEPVKKPEPKAEQKAEPKPSPSPRHNLRHPGARNPNPRPHRHPTTGRSPRPPCVAAPRSSASISGR